MVQPSLLVYCLNFNLIMDQNWQESFLQKIDNIMDLSLWFLVLLFCKKLLVKSKNKVGIKWLKINADLC